ncbi:MAG: hypothetical protein LCH63_00395 [Candidatus Melainabacteria bacterium]|nr:hypothetical protein [Candidatus Melainabacteria bacterium]
MPKRNKPNAEQSSKSSNSANSAKKNQNEKDLAKNSMKESLPPPVSLPQTNSSESEKAASMLPAVSSFSEEQMQDWQYRPGQCVMCKVEGLEPGGYTATIQSSVPPSEHDQHQHGKPRLSAFLPSTETLKIGQTVPATFVCMHNNRALMTFAFMLGTTERIQLSTAPDEENAFSIWVDSYPSSQKARRAVDLIMPSVSGKLFRELKCAPETTGTLLQELELANFTGCIKARNEEQKSRSAMLILDGRIAGAIYGRKDAHETFPVEAAIKLIREDLLDGETFLQVYELPKETVYCMASLFLGCPIMLEGGTLADKFETTLMSMNLAGETGCFTYSRDGMHTDSLIFIHEGKLFAGYEIAEQKYIDKTDALIDSLKHSDSGQLEAHLLPTQLMSSAVKFGYKLGQSNTQGNN